MTIQEKISAIAAIREQVEQVNYHLDRLDDFERYVVNFSTIEIQFHLSIPNDAATKSACFPTAMPAVVFITKKLRDQLEADRKRLLDEAEELFATSK